jgi:ABC-type transport system involved in multi-copper enzyme maturation permease subunit
LSGILRSEWTKIKSVRSTAWSLLALFVATVGIGALTSAANASSAHQGGFRGGNGIFDPVAISLAGLLFGQLAIGVLGILVVTAEYSTGTIRATFAAVPNRVLVLVSKILVFGVLALLTSEISSFVAFFVGQAILARSGVSATLSTPGALRAVIGGGLYMTVLALLALGLAAMLRHSAAAITTFVAILLVLPLIVTALPASYVNSISRYLPANIGVTMISIFPQPHEFSPWAGFALLCGYAVVALAVGGWLMATRDA